MNNENLLEQKKATTRVASGDLLAFPHCGHIPKLSASETAAWVCCSNLNDPCPGYDTDWTGVPPARIGGACSKEAAIAAWNAFARQANDQADPRSPVQ